MMRRGAAPKPDIHVYQVDINAVSCKIKPFERGICCNCGQDRGETLVCDGCGWYDPMTRPPQ